MKVSELTDEQCQKVLDAAWWNYSEDKSHVELSSTDPCIGISIFGHDAIMDDYMLHLYPNSYAYAERNGGSESFNICAVVDLLRSWNVEGFE